MGDEFAEVPFELGGEEAEASWAVAESPGEPGEPFRKPNQSSLRS